VLPYLKGLVIIKLCFSILFFYIYCGSFAFSIGYLTSGIKALSFGRHCGKIFFIFADFFFQSRKKRAATFSKFSVYFYEKFVEKGCRYEFLSEKHPI
jgi:hypothetical protein